MWPSAITFSHVTEANDLDPGPCFIRRVEPTGDAKDGRIACPGPEGRNDARVPTSASVDRLRHGDPVAVNAFSSSRRIGLRVQAEGKEQGTLAPNGAPETAFSPTKGENQ